LNSLWKLWQVDIKTSIFICDITLTFKFNAYPLSKTILYFLSSSLFTRFTHFKYREIKNIKFEPDSYNNIHFLWVYRWNDTHKMKRSRFESVITSKLTILVFLPIKIRLIDNNRKYIFIIKNNNKYCLFYKQLIFVL
jgi:hypothetical protein